MNIDRGLVLHGSTPISTKTIDNVSAPNASISSGNCWIWSISMYVALGASKKLPTVRIHQQKLPTSTRLRPRSYMESLLGGGVQNNMSSRFPGMSGSSGNSDGRR
ncbi:uncharacterized protein LOC120178839 [Hibiscus syriacus]|uniref:uncharacterized protein LOC120178839 n=1 Tax=Hibiscus syriacus TaxID=106335 RepID=UPI001920C383|nr:uncharacterized protein LOC120178839 [Hibiscus syriacus]